MGAIQYYNKVLEINPNNVDALTNKGVALSKLNNNTGVIQYYNKVLEINPNNVDALTNKGVALFQIK